MQKIGQSTASANAAGEFTSGNPEAGVDATQIMSAWLNTVQRELIAILSAVGIAPDAGRDDQVLTALWAMTRQGASSFGVDTGTVNAYTVDYAPAVMALTDGLQLRFKAKNAPTGPSTFSPNGMPPKPIVGSAGIDLQGAEFGANTSPTVTWVAALDKWQLSSGLGALQVPTATKPGHAVPFGQLASTLSAGLVKLATTAQMAAGTDPSLVPTVQAVMSLFAKRSFGANDYIRIPDVPGGLIVNWGSAIVNASGDINVNYPLAYTTLQAITIAQSGQNTDAAYLSTAQTLGGFTMPFYKTTTGAKSSGGFNAQWISLGR